MLSGAVLAVPLLTMVSCFCPCQWDFLKGSGSDRSSDSVSPPPPQRRANRGGEGDSRGCWGGGIERGKELAGERGQGEMTVGILTLK